jgi:hypothetical protein
MAHVEALLLLRRVAPEPRPVEIVAAEAQIATLPAARRCLEELAAAGLLAAMGKDEYRYAPAEADAGTAVDALAQMYNEKPVTLVRAIYSRPAAPPPMQAFADAFRLRRDES